MAIEPDDLAKFNAHMAKFRKQNAAVCPICGANRWVVDGPVAALRYEHGPPAQISIQGGPPVILAICENCFFVRQFAWLPIKTGGGRG